METQLKDNLCLTCVHHRPENTLDDVADQCYPCVWQHGITGQYINYQPNVGELLKQKLETPAAKEVKVIRKADMVNSPKHYTQGGIETIDFILAKLGKEGTIAYCMGNVIKYVTRWKDKNGIEDLKKAQWYLNYAINLMKE
jgi:hypothetical protein